MTKVLILGATGAIGRLTTDQLLDRNVDVVLFAHHPEKLDHPEFGIAGDATNATALTNAMQNVDVVFSALGPMHMPAIATAVVAAMRQAHVRRLIWIATVGIYRETPAGHRARAEAIYGNPKDATSYFGDQLRGVQIIANSNLDTTIIRPNALTNDDIVTSVRLCPKGQESSGGPISRKTIASFVTGLITGNQPHLNEDLAVSDDVDVD